MFVLTPLATDTFHRANEEPLNPTNWVENTDPAALDLAIVSNVCVTGSAISLGFEAYIGVALPADQYVSATLGLFTTSSQVFLYARTDASGISGYDFGLFGNGNGTYTFQIDGSNGLFLEGVAPTPALGDVMTLAVVGTSVVAYYNGVAVLSFTDAYTASGKTALWIGFSATRLDTSVTLFVTGGAALPPSVPGNLPLPFSKRTVAATSVFACIGIASPMAGAPLFTSNATTLAALALEYGQLVHIYPVLIHQDTANNQADLYAAVATAEVTVAALNTTIQTLTATDEDKAKLQTMQTVVANALTNLKSVIQDETAGGE